MNKYTYVDCFIGREYKHTTQHLPQQVAVSVYHAFHLETLQDMATNQLNQTLAFHWVWP